jgi:hypothetical protein
MQRDRLTGDCCQRFPFAGSATDMPKVSFPWNGFNVATTKTT